MLNFNTLRICPKRAVLEEELPPQPSPLKLMESTCRQALSQMNYDPDASIPPIDLPPLYRSRLQMALEQWKQRWPGPDGLVLGQDLTRTVAISRSISTRVHIDLLLSPPEKAGLTAVWFPLVLPEDDLTLVAWILRRAAQRIREDAGGSEAVDVEIRPLMGTTGEPLFFAGRDLDRAGVTLQGEIGARLTAMKPGDPACERCPYRILCQYPPSPLHLLSPNGLPWETPTLTASQQTMLETREGVLRIDTLPGSGVTASLLTQVFTLCKEGVDQESILMLTRDWQRVREVRVLLQRMMRRNQAPDLSKVRVTTLRSWLISLLLEDCEQTPADAVDEMRIVEEMAGLEGPPDPQQGFAQVYRQLMSSTPSEDLSLEELEVLREEFNLRLEQKGMISTGNLRLLLDRLLSLGSFRRHRSWTHILVDDLPDSFRGITPHQVLRIMEDLHPQLLTYTQPLVPAPHREDTRLGSGPGSFYARLVGLLGSGRIVLPTEMPRVLPQVTDVMETIVQERNPDVHIFPISTLEYAVREERREDIASDIKHLLGRDVPPGEICIMFQEGHENGAWTLSQMFTCPVHQEIPLPLSCNSYVGALFGLANTVLGIPDSLGLHLFARLTPDFHGSINNLAAELIQRGGEKTPKGQLRWFRDMARRCTVDWQAASIYASALRKHYGTLDELACFLSDMQRYNVTESFAERGSSGLAASDPAESITITTPERAEGRNWQYVFFLSGEREMSSMEFMRMATRATDLLLLTQEGRQPLLDQLLDTRGSF